MLKNACTLHPAPRLRRKSGFTLIELSIVLVIIGLIVGGVLVGQDLIKAAEVRAQISQIEKYNTAVRTFQGKYGYLPGDILYSEATNFGFTVGTNCIGQLGGRDGNGLLETAYINGLHILVGEDAAFWVDLTTAGLIDQNFPNSGATAIDCVPLGGSADFFIPSYTSFTVNHWLPVAKIGYGTTIYAYSNSGYNWFGLSSNLHNGGVGGVFMQSDAALPVNIAYSIDKKIDDGIPLSGNIIAKYVDESTGNYFSQTNSPNAATDDATTCYNTSVTIGVYSVGYKSGTSPNCALSFRFQ